MSLFKTYKESFDSLVDRNQQLRFLILLLFAFSLPFPKFYSAIALNCLVVLTVFDINRQKFKQIPKYFWHFQLVFVLGLLGYYQSFHRSDASFLLERQLSIAFFPILFPLAFTIQKKAIEGVLLTISLACFAAIVFLFGKMTYMIFYTMHLPFFKVLGSGVFFNHGFSKAIGIHAGYLSLYVAFSMVYLLSVFKQQNSILAKFLLGFVILVLLLGLVFLASRNVILSLVFIMIFVYPYFYIKNKLRYYLIALSSILIIVLTFQTNPYLKDRFSVQLVSDIKSLHNGKFISYSATEPRIERWKCAVALIKKSPVFGYGTGDEIKMLKTEYMKNGLFISYLEEFNAHNEYLSYLLKNGIVGLLFFLGIFFYYLRLAIYNKHFVYLCFLVLMLIGFYTENILDSNKGILFFALFNTLLGFSCLANNKSLIEKPNAAQQE